MKIHIIILVILTALFLTIPASASEFKNVGHSGANFLQIPVDARGAGMGNSYIALARGADGLYWNPAGIQYTTGTEIMLSTVDWFLDTRLSHLGIVHSFGRYGTFGLSISSFTMDEMEVTTELYPNGTGEFFDAGNLSLGASYAIALTDQFAFGGTVKYIREEIWEASSSTVSFDLGSVFRTSFYNLRIGMIIANFGPKMRMSGATIDQKINQEEQAAEPNNPRLQRLSPEYNLPQYFEVGVAFDPVTLPESQRLTLAVSANDPNDNQTRMNFGAEYAFREMIMLRAGYKTGYDEQKFSLGLGARLEISGIQSQLDYAYVDFGVLKEIHYLTFKVQF